MNNMFEGSLEDQLRDVTPPSSAAPKPDPIEPDPIEPDPVEPDPKVDDRPPENIRGELLRRMDKAQAEQNAKIDAIADRFEAALQDVAGRLQAPSNQPTTQPGGNPLDQYSIEDLQAAMVNEQVPEETRRTIQAYLPVRVAREEARTISMQNRSEDKAERTRSEARQAAVDRFPELLDPTSKLHQETNRIILARRQQGITDTPTTILDAANEAFQRVGPESQPNDPRRVRIPGRPAGNRQDAPVKSQDDDQVDLTDAEIDAIAPKLQHVMGRNPDGTPKTFDRKWLKERAKLYRDRY